jgi:uncharacterized phiE125 gp8 family phage protein
MKCYGTIELTVSSPAQSFCEPLSIAEVREFLKLPESSPADENEAALLESFVIGAREVAETFQNRDLTMKQYDNLMDYFRYEIELRTPLRSVDLIRYRDSDGNYTDLVEGTDYIVDLARGLVMPPYGESWPSFTPWPSSAVLIRFTSGYAEDHPFWSHAGQRVLTGMKQLVSAWFHERLPFELSNLAIQEYPFSVTSLLSFGALPRVR